MPLPVGSRLGPYEIVALLGAGGMGEVYRARDTRLGREVALKVLASEVASDPSRRQRFELEARAVAALSHPNIVALYDVGDEGGVFYIVSELVDGEPLRGKKFGARKTLDIAAQIAAGLAAAHDAHIVHRDLKPDNILLTRDGRVKILDFGLAKFAAGPRAAAAAGETQTQTEPGVVMGTVGYMSPEQVRGASVDHRSDIFSFGLILHELLRGERAFRGDTSVEIMTAILKADPPDLPETVPAGLRQIVGHCVEKDPANRFQSARDLGFALTQADAQPGRTSSRFAIVPGRSSRMRRAILAAGSAALLILAAIAGRLLWPANVPSSWTAQVLGGPEIAMTPRLSPDGHTLAFVTLEDGQSQVAVIKPESGNWTTLTHNREKGSAITLSWSPDGTRIYYDRFTDVPKGIYSVPVLGGKEQLVMEDAMLPEALPDGTLLLVRLNPKRELQVFRFWPDNGRLQGLSLKIESAIVAMFRAVPGGREAAVIGTPIGPGQPPGKHLFAIDLASARVRRIATGLTDETFLVGLAASRDSNTVLAAPFPYQLAAIPLGGQSAARNLFSVTSFIYSADAAPDGGAYVDQVDRPEAVVRFSVKGGAVRKVAGFPKIGLFGLLSLPDGRAVVATPFFVDRAQLLAVEPDKGGVPMVNTSEPTASPFTLAGPEEFAFLIGPASRRTIAFASVATGRVTRRIPFDKGSIQSMAATPDGKTLYCSTSAAPGMGGAPGSGGTVWAVPSSGGEPTKVCAGDAVAVDPAGQYLVVLVAERGATRIVRVPLHGGAEQEVPIRGAYRAPANGLGANPIDRDGHLLTALCSPDSWFCGPGVIDLATGRTARIPVNDLADFMYLSWTPDGQIVGVASGLSSTIWKFTPERH